MIFLAGGGFPVLEPSLGLIFWMTIIFGLTWLILGKFAFKPIAKALRDREASIDNAIKSAERARAEVAELKNENEELLKQAKEERSKILKEANEIKVQIISEAKEEANKEASKLISDAKVEIANQKSIAMSEVRKDVGTIALEIAEKLVRKDLGNSDAHKTLISSLVKEANFNQN